MYVNQKVKKKGLIVESFTFDSLTYYLVTTNYELNTKKIKFKNLIIKLI